MRKVAMSHLIKTIALTCALSTSAWVYGSDCTKHGDIQNIGNRSVSGKIWGILPNFVSFERRSRSEPRLPLSSSRRHA